MKKWLLIAAILLAAGLIIGTTALALAGFDFAKLGTREMVTNIYTTEAAFTNIWVEAITADITFLPSEDGQVKAVCYTDSKLSYGMCVEGDTLIISYTDNRKWYDHIGFSWEKSTIAVYLPAGEYGDLQLGCTTGNVQVPEHFTFRNAQLDMTTGDTCWKAGVSQKLSIQCTTGNVAVAQVLCSQMHIKTTTGNVQLSGVDASQIEIKTTTGNVTGTLLSGKEFTTKVSTGDVNVPKSSAGGTCKVTTTTGDIDLKIAE